MAHPGRQDRKNGQRPYVEYYYDATDKASAALKRLPVEYGKPAPRQVRICEEGRLKAVVFVFNVL